MTMLKTLKKHCFVLSIMLVMLVYLPINYNHCLSVDDLDLLNRIEKDFKNIDYVTLFFPNIGMLYFRPLLEISFYFDYAIWGNTIGGYHFTNYLLHIINAGLLFNIGLHIFKTSEKQYFYAAVSMLIFALNPLTCESVAWVSGRSDIAGTFFSLLTVNFFFITHKLKFFLVPLFALLGLFCKENTFSVFPVIFFLEGFMKYKQGKNIQTIFKSIGLWVVIIMVPVALYVFLRTAGGTDIGSGADRIAAAATVSRTSTPLFHLSGYLKIFPAIAFYLKKLLIPYPLNFSISTINYTLYSTLFVIIAALNIYWIKIKKYDYTAVVILLVTSFLPAIPIAIGGISWAPFAERYLYFSLCIWGLSVSYLTSSFVSNGKLKKNTCNIILSILIMISAVSTIERQTDWQSNKTILSKTIAVSPDNYKAILNYAISYNSKERIIYLRKAEAASKDTRDLSWKAGLYRAIAYYYADYNTPDNYLTPPGTEQKPKSTNTKYVPQELSENEIVLNVFENIDTGLTFHSSRKAYLESALIVLKLEPKDVLLQKQIFRRAKKYYSEAYKKKPTAFLMYRIGGLERLLDKNENAAECFRNVISKFPESSYAGYSKTRLRKFKEEGLIK